VQISDLQAIESYPTQGTYAQNRSNVSFEQLLEEQQKKLTLLFSPFGQYNFGSWFSYASLDTQLESATPIFSDTDQRQAREPDTSSYDSAKQSSGQEAKLEPSVLQFNSRDLPKSVQSQIQTLLAQNGWLTPNLEALAPFLRAQMQGTLLAKLDLQSLVDEIVSRVEMVKEKGKTELTLGLHPKDLGEILLTLTSKSGMISIQIQAPEETRKMLEAEIKNLESALKKAKVNLLDIRVSAIKEAKENA
jgi:hypothetical protein